MPSVGVWREFISDYFQGLRNLPELVRRISFKRRNLDDELVEASLRGTLRRTFTGWELFLFGIGVVVGSGVYSLTGTSAWLQAGPAVVVSYSISGVASLCAAAIYGEFVTEYPVSGGGFTYTMLTFGEFPAFLTVCNLILSYTVGMAAVAKNFAVNLATLTNRKTLIVELGGPGSWQLDFFAFGLVLLATVVLAIGSKEYSFLVSGATVVKLGVILVIIVASFTRADPANLHPFLKPPGGAMEFTGADGIFQAMAISYYNYVGFDALTNATEEAQNPADLPLAILGTVIASLLIYVCIALSFSMMAPADEVPNNLPRMVFSLPFVSLVWVKYLVAIVGILAVLAGLLVGLFSLARLVMVAARDWLLPPFLARVYSRTQTPVAAQCVVGVVVAVLALVVPVVHLAILVSFGTMFAMWMVCNAHLFRRYYPDVKLRYTKYGIVEEAAARKEPHMEWVPGRRLSQPLQKALVWVHLVMISGISVGLALFWRVSGGNGGVLGFLGGWALATLCLQLLCPLEYQPACKWAVPWWALPWLPSFAIVLLVFSIGSLDWEQQYWRICSFLGACLLFYLLFSLPMSYIKRRRLDYINTEQLNVVQLTLTPSGKWAAYHGSTPAASELSPIPHSARTSFQGSNRTSLAPANSMRSLKSQGSTPTEAFARRSLGLLSPSAGGSRGGMSTPSHLVPDAGTVSGFGPPAHIPVPAASNMFRMSGSSGGIQTPLQTTHSGSDALQSMPRSTMMAAVAAVKAAIQPQGSRPLH